MKLIRKPTYFMTLFNRIPGLLIGLLLSASVFSQDLYNETNSAKFAGYLYQTHQFRLASEEYERLEYMNPGNLEYKLSLIRCYRFLKNYDYAEKRFLMMFQDSIYNLSAPVASEYLKLNLLQGNLTGAQDFLTRASNLGQPLKQKYQEYIYLLGRQWKQSDLFLQQNQGLDPRFRNLTNEALRIKYKSPLLASTFSAVIPGTGKIYSGFWKDGLIALLFVSVNSWQAYRGFTKYGANAPHGWIFGGIATGFYLGNIYGSWKSAQKHNKKANDEIYLRSKNIIYSDF